MARRLIALLIAAAALPASNAPARAGGFDFDVAPHPDDVGPPYSGVVTDDNGAPIRDAKIAVTARLLGGTIFERTDSQGHFFVEGFDKSINPTDVIITCTKDGYTSAAATKTTPAGPDTPVDAVCILHKQ